MEFVEEDRGIEGWIPFRADPSWRIKAEFVLDGKVLECDRILASFRPPSRVGFPQKNYGQGLRVGAEVKVFYNPDSPSQSCLYPGWVGSGVDLFAGTLGGFGLIVGLLMLKASLSRTPITDGVIPVPFFNHKPK